MGRYKTRELVSILMESPLYPMLSAEEAHLLVKDLAESYPFLLDGKGEGANTGYGSGLGGGTTH